MWSTGDVFRLLAISHLGVLAAICLREHRRDRSAVASVLFIATIICHLAGPLLRVPEVPALLQHLAVLGSLAVPFTLWELARVHFDDDFRLRPWHLGLLAALVLPGYVSWLVLVERSVTVRAGAETVWLVLPRLLALAVVLHALLDVYVGARSDLLVARLKLRYGVLSVSGTYILIELLAEILVRSPEAQALAEDVHDVTTYLVVAGISLASLLVRPEVLKPQAPAPAPALDPRLAERLTQLVEIERAYLQEGLTIGALAARLDAPEHKVRQLINAQLGFKNFNAFLNHYRVREARQNLADPGRRHLGVAQVAYEVGYRSLGPFNKAFKELTGQTPTDYRSAVLRAAEPAATEPRVS